MRVSSRPTVVFVHHFGGSAGTWDQVVAILGPDYSSRAIDLPGFGEAAAAVGPYAVADYVDAVEALIGAEGLSATIVVGHSMGGKVALALAAGRPAHLRALLLLAPSPPTPEPIEEAARQKSIDGWGDRGNAARMLAVATANPLSIPAQGRAIDDMMRCGRAAWTAWLTSGSREDISADTARIDVPVTILSGTGDTVIPIAVLRREVAGRLAAARVELVSGAGHLLNLEAPLAVADAVRRLVDECRLEN